LVLDTGRGSGVPNSARALENWSPPRGRVGTAVESVIDGKAEAVRLALIVLLAEGHLLIEDVPGVGKTMLAKALARSIDGTVAADPVHPRPAAERHHRGQRLQPGAARVRVQAGAGVREHRGRRRDQPGLAQDPVGRCSSAWKSGTSRSTAPPTC